MNNFIGHLKAVWVGFFFYMSLVAALMLFISLQVATSFFDGDTDRCVTLSDPFIFETSAHTAGKVLLPARINVPEDGRITITGRLPGKITTGTYLAYYPYHQEAEVRVNGWLRGHYNGTASVFETNLVSKGIRLLPLWEEDANGVLSITYTSTERRYIGVLNEIRVGTRPAIIHATFGNGVFVLIIGVFLMFCGVALIGVCFTETDNAEVLIPYAYLGITMTLSGFWFVLQTNVGQIVIGNTAWLQWMESLSLAMIPFPLARFCDICERGIYRKACNIVCAFDLFVIFFDLLLFWKKIDMLSCVWLVHLALAAVGLYGAVSILLLRMNEKEVYADIRWVSAAGLYLFIFGGMEYLLYYLQPNYSDGTCFSVGALTFLFGCFIWVRRRHVSREAEEEALHVETQMKNALLQNISSAIHNPAKVIVAESSQIVELTDNDKIKKAAGEAGDEAHKLLVILDDVMDYVKLETNMMVVEESPYETVALMRALRRQAKRSQVTGEIKFLFHAGHTVPKTLQGDESKIRRIAEILLTQSFFFTKEGFVKLDIDFVKSDLWHGDLIFTVEDSGGGIPKDSDIAKVFSMNNPKREIGGPEMALSVAGGMTALLGGEIKMKESSEKGTTVVVKIPQQIIDATAVSS